MCDTLCSISPEATIFAKSSDRPVGEPQVVEQHRRRPPGGACRTQYLDLGADPGAAAFVGSRPTWLWGVEHGVNEHGVAVGNEKIWTTDDPRRRPPALLGMDIVRLALERAHDADHALEIITELVERHGQGGSGEAEHDEPYDNSFLVADAATAWIVETSDRTWAARRTASGGTAISNRVSLRTDHDRRSADVEPGADFDLRRAPKIPTALADHRLAVTRACAEQAPTPAAVVGALRSHGGSGWGRPDAHAGAVEAPEAIPSELGADTAGVTVCMHVRDYQVTAASMVADLPRDPDAPTRLWVCLGSPCVSIFVPVLAHCVPPRLADPALWWRFDALRRQAESDPHALHRIRAATAPFEAACWSRADERFAAGNDDPTAWQADAAGIDALLTSLGV